MTRLLDVCNHNRPKRTPERRRRRPDLHGRILRCPAATPRMALRRRRPLHAVPNRIDVHARFAPLMRWALSLWKSNDLALAVDPITLSDNLRVIVVSMVYQGYAIPVACVVMHANKPGKRIEPAAEPLTAACRHSHTLPPSFPRKRESRRLQPSSLPKSSTNLNHRIPSPFMGLQG